MSWKISNFLSFALCLLFNIYTSMEVDAPLDYQRLESTTANEKEEWKRALQEVNYEDIIIWDQINEEMFEKNKPRITKIIAKILEVEEDTINWYETKQIGKEVGLSTTFSHPDEKLPSDFADQVKQLLEEEDMTHMHLPDNENDDHERKMLTKPYKEAEKKLHICNFANSSQVNEFLMEKMKKSTGEEDMAWEIRCEDNKKYLAVLCSHMKKAFEFELEDLRPKDFENMIKVVESYSKNFKTSIENDKWRLLDREIISKVALKKIENLLAQDDPDREELIIQKRAVLLNIADFYAVYAKDKHQATGCLQISYVLPKLLILLKEIFKSMKNTCCDIGDCLKNKKCKCDVMKKIFSVKNMKQWRDRFRKNLLPLVTTYICYHMLIFVPSSMVVEHAWDGEDDESTKWCPQNSWELNNIKHFYHWKRYKMLSAKVTGCILLYTQWCFLADNSKNEYEKYKINWQSQLFGTWGLNFDLFLNRMSSVLVMFVTMILNFQQHDLQDIVLNYMVFVFIVNYDEEIANYHKVSKGKRTRNDDGVLIYLDYIENGPRYLPEKDFEKMLVVRINKKFDDYFFVVYFLVLALWSGSCI